MTLSPNIICSLSEGVDILDEDIKISACYIVKNEEKNLRTSLDSLKDSADEIIIVDTGSTDNTLEVAKSFGAKIFYEVWQDDFSAPRNIALDYAEGDWIIFLDADEYFTAETAKNIRTVIENIGEENIGGLLIHLVNIDVENENRVMDSAFVLRIFRNLRGLQYVGKIHEELKWFNKNLPNMIPIPAEILTLYHTGYSATVNKFKAERNLKLLLEELESTDTPQRVYGHIAQCYHGLDDFVNAEKFARLDIAADIASTFSSRSYRILLNVLARDKFRLDERQHVAEMAIQKFSALPDFYAESAECYAAHMDFKSAVREMTTALEKFKTYDGMEPSIFNAELAKFAQEKIKNWIKILSQVQG